VKWPDGKLFAFTIVDDTDNATVANTKPFYDFLGSLGIRITKTVWPLRSDPADPAYAQSLEDNEYLEFVLSLQEAGFEIGYHGPRAGSNERSVIHESLALFREKLGHDPVTYAHHSDSKSNIYWGSKRTRIPVERCSHDPL